MDIIMNVQTKMDKRRFEVGDIIFVPKTGTVNVVLGIQKDTNWKVSYELFIYNFDYQTWNFKYGKAEAQIVGELVKMYFSGTLRPAKTRVVSGKENVLIGKVDADYVKRIYAMSKCLDNSLPVIEFTDVTQFRKFDWAKNQTLLSFEEQKQGYFGKDGRGKDYYLLGEYDKYYVYLKINWYAGTLTTELEFKNDIISTLNQVKQDLNIGRLPNHRLDIVKKRKKLVETEIHRGGYSYVHNSYAIKMKCLNRKEIDFSEEMLKRAVELKKRKG